MTTTSGMSADYDAHSEYQRRVVEGGDKLIRELVAALDLPALTEADPEAGRYEAWIVRVTFARSA